MPTVFLPSHHHPSVFTQATHSKPRLYLDHQFIAPSRPCHHLAPIDVLKLKIPAAAPNCDAAAELPASPDACRVTSFFIQEEPLILLRLIVFSKGNPRPRPPLPPASTITHRASPSLPYPPSIFGTSF